VQLDRQGGLGDRAQHAGVTLEIDFSAVELGAAEIAPRQR
jgi:hypothetical protein